MMACSSLRLSNDEKNFWRFCMLNSRTAPSALRHYFDHVIPPHNLPNIINAQTKTILQLIKRKVINKKQVKVLQRIPGTTWPLTIVQSIGSATSSKDFDVTLMICLIRNLTGIKDPSLGWDNHPPLSEKTPEAFIARIKYYRNILAHSTETLMTDRDFQSSWNSITEAVNFLNNGVAPSKDINDILYLDLDGSQTSATVALLSHQIKLVRQELSVTCNTNKELQKNLDVTEEKLKNVQSQFMSYKDGQLPRNIADNIKATITRWESEDNIYYETRATTAAKDALDTFQIVLISGNSGTGKTAAARHIALHLQKQGFCVVPIESVDDIINHRCKDKKQVFLIDDVVGKYTLDNVNIYQWENLDQKLKFLFDNEHNGVKLIITLRQNLLESEIFSSGNTVFNDKAKQINFSSSEYNLSEDEKYAILQNHLIKHNKESDLSEEEKKRCCRGTLAFPLNCRLFVTNSRWFDRKDLFFKKPFAHLIDELTMLHHRNKELYCVLVLCMLFSGKLPTELLDVSNNLDMSQDNLTDKHTKVKNVIEACGLPREISRETLLSSLKSVKGIYINKSLLWNCYEFVHDYLLEVVNYHFASVQPRVCMRYCDMQFLSSRVRVCKCSEDDDECVIVLGEGTEIELCQRFVKELQNGMFIDVLCSQPMKDAKFVSKLGAYIEQEGVTNREDLLNTTISYKYENLCLLNGLSSNLLETIYCDQSLKKRSFKLSRLDGKKHFLYWVVASGCYHLFLFFWNKMSRRRRNIYLGKGFGSFFTQPILPLALLNGDTDILRTLVESVPEIKCPSAQQMLREIVEEGKNMKVLQVLKEKNVKLNFIDNCKRTLLFYAISSKNETMQYWFLASDISAGSVLEAVLLRDTERVRTVLSVENITNKTCFGWTVFHIAAFNNDVNMMNILLEENAGFQKTKSIYFKFKGGIGGERAKDIIGMTPLHVATIMNSYEMVILLTEKDKTVLDRDFCGNTPFYYCTNEQVGARLVEKELQGNKASVIQFRSNINLSTFCFDDSCSEQPSNSTVIELYSSVDDSEIEQVTSSLWSMIYIVFCNLQLFAFNTQFFRRQIDRANYHGDTMLHIAARNGCFETFKLLLLKDANPYTYSFDGCLPFETLDFKKMEKKEIENYKRRIASQERTILINLFKCFGCVYVVCNIITALILRFQNQKYEPMQFYVIRFSLYSFVLSVNFIHQSLRVNMRFFFAQNGLSVCIYVFTFLLIMIKIANTEDENVSIVTLSLIIMWLVVSLGLFAIDTCRSHPKVYDVRCIFRAPYTCIIFVPIFLEFGFKIYNFVINEFGTAVHSFEVTPLFMLCMILSLVSMVIYVICFPSLVHQYELSHNNFSSKLSNYYPLKIALSSFYIFSLLVVDLLFNLVMSAV